MKFISLFSGIGGFDLAFERAGMECVTVCEIDKNAQNILRRHFPNATLYDDVRKVGKETHERKSIDLICGGFPCQDLSVAGKRKGLAGERSGLWFEFARIIDELEPRWVVIENVPGLLSSHKGKDFAIIIQRLAERGYGVTWRVLDAQYFGVPQRRRRVFIVGSFGSGSSAEALFESEVLCGDNPPSREIGKDVAYSLRADASHSGDKGDGGINTTLVNTNWLPQRVRIYDDSGVAPTLSHEEGRGHGVPIVYKRRGGFGYSTEENLSPTLESQGGSHQGSPDNLPIVFQQNTRDEVRLINGDGQIAGALASQAGTKQQNYIAFTVHGEHSTAMTGNGNAQVAFETERARSLDTTGGYATNQGGTIIKQSFGIRRLTPTECERLQGFPDGWTDGQADTVRYRQLGNAVAVPVVEWIGKRIMQIKR